ncbi:response regulator [Thermosulfuriphilus ammonigenes]|uniref:Response regulator n=1 Tax=Thermosulfuriphilus ammonigenes TaxID=1936021 RepID=A0A6G7PX49_9BACT|nr:response regulator [Thermosulfuriphilus ammonigenes]MBA2849670.1 CheY-like chemotaxis protein [Thermosulfuriphilus ammonigenes]QIJ72232.1 response regulator [Thermosulfuriphilus ammonigenes]
MADRPSVLVVDDEPLVRQIMVEMLKHLGIETSEAQDGSEAKDLTRTHKFSLIFLDVSLPDIDGRNLAPMLKQISPESRIVIASGYEVDPASVPGADAFLKKPFSLASLKEIVSSFFGPKDLPKGEPCPS